MEKFGERIRKLRQERGLTTHEMAEKLGISRNTLTNWERGTKEIYGIKLLEEMAEILEVPLKILLSGEKEISVENNPVIKNVSLGNILNEVSQAEEKIVSIDIENLESNPRNFYGLRDIDSLAALISVSHLVEPLTSFENSAYVHEFCKENELDYIGYMENPHDLRTADVMRLLEEVARIREHRLHDKISYIKNKWMPGDTIWTHILLKRFFSVSIENEITLTFKQIEEIEGKKLRPESKKAEFWTERKKSYKTIADTWKSEGYELEKLGRVGKQRMCGIVRNFFV